MLRKILRELKENGIMRTIFSVILLVFLFLILLTHLCSCSKSDLAKTADTIVEVIESYPADNPAEQAGEAILEIITGQERDFSPWNDNTPKGWGEED